MRVSAYDAASNAWTEADGGTSLQSPGAGNAEYPHMANLNGTIYIAWSERRGGILHVRVMRGDLASP